MIRIGILGSSGKVGQKIEKILKESYSNNTLVVARSHRNSPLEPLLNAEVVIDFSCPESISELVDLALAKKTDLPAFVVGTTGLSPKTFEKLQELSAHTSVFFSANFSVGVSLLVDLLQKYSPAFSKLGFTPVIVETHHIHKKDAPSGTAIRLQQAIHPKNSHEIQTHSIRAGEVIGEHQVSFYGNLEQIHLTHSAQDRSIYAQGAIQIALWLVSKKSQTHTLGILGMESYLNEQLI